MKFRQYCGDIYIFIILLLFPFVLDKTRLFHVLELKWYFYVSITLLYLMTLLLSILYDKVILHKKIIEHNRMNMGHILVILLLVGNIISTLFSPYIVKYNLLKGVGRGEGLLVNILYLLSFLSLSLFNKFQRKYCFYFIISSIIMSVIILFQYLGFNPLYIYKYGGGSFDFLGTIGNKDTVSALYTIFISIAISMYILLDNSYKTKLLLFVSILLSWIVLKKMDVDSSKVAIFSLLVLIIPYAISSKDKLIKISYLIYMIFLSYLQLNILFFVIAIFILFIIIFIKYRIKEYSFAIDKKYVIKISVITTCLILAFLIYIYFYIPHSNILSQLHQIMHGNFDDKLGSYRLFLWKRTLHLSKHYFLLGSGPDTFAIRFMARYTADIAKLGPITINDTAANIYLTMLINNGFIGLLLYLSFLFITIKKGFKSTNNYIKILLLAIIVYSIQAFFNLSVVIVTPFFWILCALFYMIIEEKV